MYEDGSVIGMIQQLAPYRGIALGVFLGLPVLTWLVGRALKRFSRRACAWFLTVPVHLTVISGMMMSLLLAYILFMSGSNLLARYDVVFFFGPIVAMVLTFVVARKLLPFKEIPGSSRLVGVFMTGVLMFAVLYVLDRMRFLALVAVSPKFLLILFVFFLILVEVATSKMSGSKSDETQRKIDSIAEGVKEY